VQQRTQTLSNPPGDQCFNDIVDYEQTTFLTTGDYSYAPQPVYWWRWEWTPVTADQTGWYVTASGLLNTGGSGTSFSVVSDHFDIKLNLYYSALVSDPNRNIACKNASDREAVHTQYSDGPNDPPPDAGGGWFDAGMENGENRAHGTFVSAFCNLLRRRRAQMSTAEVRDVIHQIAVGSDFLVMMGPSENTYSNRNDFFVQHVTATDRETDFHHLMPFPATPTAQEIAGHIYHEHHTRHHGGRPGVGPGNANDLDDINNKGNYIWMSCAGLADAGRTLKSFDASRAGAYYSQAVNTRAYLYALSSQFGGAPDRFVPYRAQAMLNFLLYDYSQDAQTLDDGRYALAQDLIKNPPHSPAVVGPWWTVGALLKNT
jgi:hypothetical protein